MVGFMYIVHDVHTSQNIYRQQSAESSSVGFADSTPVRAMAGGPESSPLSVVLYKYRNATGAMWC